MKRVLLGLALGSAAVLAAAPSAFAHGGQYRAPGGAVPPGLREPSDPTPPPPPPPTTPPGPTTPPDTPPSGGPTTPTTPNQPGTPPPSPVTPDDPTSPGGRKPQTSYDQWIFWWNYNSDDILQIKDAIYKLRATAGSPLGVVGGDSSRGGKSDATRATEKEVHDKVIPALRWAMDPANKQHPDTESASYIALAKITDDPADIALLMKAVVDKASGKKPGGLDQIVNESAALSLGLLRRTDRARQFDPKELDRVRDFCFDAFHNDNLVTRTRAFAMLSLGLLGDQPTTTGAAPTSGGGLFYAPDPAAFGPTTADRIYEGLKDKYADEQLYVASMIALSMQDPVSIKPEMLDTLKDCALKAKLFKENVSDLVASYATLALGRMGNAKTVTDLSTALKIKQTGTNVKRSAAISLGKLAQRVDGVERANLALELWRTLESVKEPSTRNFGIISLAYVLIEDIKADKTDVVSAKGVKVHEELLKIAKDGRYSERPYGALALGLVGRAIGDRPAVEAYGKFRQDAIEILRAGLSDKKIDKRAQGAFAVALGMMKDDGAKKDLLAIVSDRSGDNELRGYCAVALGMAGIGGNDVLKAIKEALRERSSEELRLQCAISLGLLGVSDAVPTLLQELKEADTQNVQGQVVIALAKIGDARAIQPLVDILKDSGRPDVTRAISCAGLGLIGDLELVPSLSHISKDINFRAACDIVNEVLSIL
ncbi:MAG: HEAT repeat domain-containing protein [Planctomycetes bacterium]|nr:HEAT repeat domain-containing protein [Planctomycetota bacterium]